MKSLKILIIEDEQRAGEKLLDALVSVAQNAAIEWKRSVTETIEYLEEDPKLDVIFSDIELLDGNVFEVFKAIEPKCPVIFCTAYNTFYVDAFKTNGIGYLLKPFTQEDFKKAWDKFHLLFETEQTNASANLLLQLKSLVNENNSVYKTTFSVKRRDGVFLLNVNDIIYFQAQGDFVFAIDTNDKKHIINNTLTKIENQLNPKDFFRINRSEILSFHNIIKYSSYRKNRLEITLKNDKVLFTSNSKAPNFRNWVER